MLFILTKHPTEENFPLKYMKHWYFLVYEEDKHKVTLYQKPRTKLTKIEYDLDKPDEQL